MRSSLCLALLLPLNLFSQIEGHENAVGEAIDLFLEKADEDIDDQTIENLRWQLEKTVEKPIQINQCKKKDLSILPFLDDQMLTDIIEYRNQFGPIIAIEELQQINSLNREIILSMKAFISFKSNEVERNEIEKKYHHKLLFRSKMPIEKMKGFTEDNGFLGQAHSSYFRMQSELGKHLNFALSGENDIGETYLNSDMHVMDHHSFFIEYQSQKKVSKLIVGDYQVSFGQGLVINSSLGVRKSAQVLSIQQYRSGIFAHRSGSELFYLRGLASEMKFKKMNLTVFASRKQIDVSQQENGLISSINQSGLHRTESELARRKNSVLVTAGLNVDCHINGWILGLTYVSNLFDRNFQRTIRVSERFDDIEKMRNNIGVHFERSFKNVNLFGELAFDQHQNKAYVVGSTFMPASKVSMAIHLRNIEAAYNSLQMNVLSERSNPRSERGIYTGIKIKLSRRISSSISIDEYRHDWLNASNNGLTNGREIMTGLTYSMNHEGELNFRFRMINDVDIFNAPNQRIDKEHSSKTRQLRLQYQWHSHSFLRWKIRWERVFNDIDLKRTQGQLCFLEIKFKKPKTRLSFVSRYTLFETENFVSRIYTYDHDVSGLFLNTAHFDHGMNFYLLMKYKMGYYSELQVKYNHMMKHRVFSLGSGLSETEGNTRRTINVALLFKF